MRFGGWPTTCARNIFYPSSRDRPSSIPLRIKTRSLLPHDSDVNIDDNQKLSVRWTKIISISHPPSTMQQILWRCSPSLPLILMIRYLFSLSSTWAHLISPYLTWSHLVCETPVQHMPCSGAWYKGWISIYGVGCRYAVRAMDAESCDQC